MAPSVEPVATSAPVPDTGRGAVPIADPLPPADPFGYYLTDEFTRELTALVRRGQKLAEAETERQGRHECP